MNSWRRLTFAVSLLGLVIVLGTSGYLLFGWTLLDAVYQTVTTVSTVGFREVRDLGTGERIFTIGLILTGVGTAFYTLTALMEAFIEGDLSDAFGKRQMERNIAKLHDHVIVCGWGRVGKALAQYVAGAGGQLVIIDNDPDRLDGIDHGGVLGDATDDNVLREAGIERARALVAAIDTDAENISVTLSARTIRPDLFIVARARMDASEEKLLRAGADRVVNPQRLGGARMAALVLQPGVAEFLDVVMHDGSLEFRLEEVAVPDDSPFVGQSLRDAHVRDQTGALVLALLDRDGNFNTNPPPETRIESGQVLIAIGTAVQLKALSEAAQPRPQRAQRAQRAQRGQ